MAEAKQDNHKHLSMLVSTRVRHGAKVGNGGILVSEIRSQCLHAQTWIQDTYKKKKNDDPDIQVM